MHIFGSLLLMFYAAGSLLLPGGHFELLKELPEMYRHCKATEDKDLTPLDFVKDHLTCFDALVDSHPPGDEQRPHSPPRSVDNSVMVQSFLHIDRHELCPPGTGVRVGFVDRVELYEHHHSVSVFRPPIG